MITANNVTLDLNGFSIIGPNFCNGYRRAGSLILYVSGCSSFGLGDGVLGGDNTDETSGVDHIKVLNGTIQGMGQFGISLTGNAFVVDNVNVISNGSIGVDLEGGHGSDKILKDSIVSRNGGGGAFFTSGLAIRNTFSLNTSDGLTFVFVGSAFDNIFSGNSGYGLSGGISSSQYRGNTFSKHIGPLNTDGTGYASGGVNTGQNVCDNTICP